MNDKMTLISNIEVIETDCDPIEIISRSKGFPDYAPVNGGSDMVSIERLSELVRGRVFCRPDGSRITIGNTKQAADIIGIQYEAWEEVQERCSQYYNQWSVANQKLEGIYSYSFLQRLSKLFKGFK